MTAQRTILVDALGDVRRAQAAHGLVHGAGFGRPAVSETEASNTLVILDSKRVRPGSSRPGRHI